MLRGLGCGALLFGACGAPLEVTPSEGTSRASVAESGSSEPSTVPGSEADTGVDDGADVATASVRDVDAGDATSQSPAESQPQSQAEPPSPSQAEPPSPSQAEGGQHDTVADAGECDKATQALSDYVTRHQSCGVDGDCGILGSCSPFHFSAMARSALSGAGALFGEVGRACAQRLGADGMTYDSYCDRGTCAVRPSGHYCGQPLQPVRPACDVSLALEFEVGTRQVLGGTKPTATLALHAVNNASAPLTISVPARCAAAYRFDGLGDVRLWPEGVCGALFACAPDAMTQVVLSAGETVLLESFALLQDPVCGASVPRGEYDVSVHPFALQGATVCQARPVHVKID